MSRPGTLALALAFGLVSIALMMQSDRPLLWPSDRALWTETPGRIIASDVRKGPVNRFGGQLYEFVVAYQYAVDGQARVGHQVQDGPRYVFKRTANRFAERYPVGAAVDVHYRRSEPTEARLVPGTPWIRWTLLGTGGAGLAAALLILKSLFRARNDA